MKSRKIWKTLVKILIVIGIFFILKGSKKENRRNLLSEERKLALRTILKDIKRVSNCSMSKNYNKLLKQLKGFKAEPLIIKSCENLLCTSFKTQQYFLKTLITLLIQKHPNFPSILLVETELEELFLTMFQRINEKHFAKFYVCVSEADRALKCMNHARNFLTPGIASYCFADKVCYIQLDDGKDSRQGRLVAQRCIDRLGNMSKPWESDLVPMECTEHFGGSLNWVQRISGSGDCNTVFINEDGTLGPKKSSPCDKKTVDDNGDKIKVICSRTILPPPRRDLPFNLRPKPGQVQLIKQ